MAVKKTEPGDVPEEIRAAAGAGAVEPWSGYTHFAYVGPSLPGGVLKQNAILTGSFAKIKAYLADALEKYPQAEKLIFPVEKMGEQLKRVKTAGNITNKYFNDLFSLTHTDKEV